MSLDFYLHDAEGNQVYWANITHNLGRMAKEAGIYQCLWRPEEVGITAAGQIAEGLEAGLMDMMRRPSHYKQFDAPNGWGKYEHFLPWLTEVLEACRAHPTATVYASV